MPIKHKSHLHKCTSGSVRERRARDAETEEETQERLQQQQGRQARARSRETPQENERRLQQQQARQERARSRENRQENEQRLRGQQERQARARSRETPQENEQRLEGQQERQSRARSRETPQENEVRIRTQRLRQHALREHENHADYEARLEGNRIRASNYFRRKWESMHRIAFNYHSDVSYNEHSLIQIGAMDQICSHCGALKWRGETPGMCCSDGKVHLPFLEDPPEPLRSLLMGNSEESRTFLKSIRRYNACFVMTSFGADKIIRQPGFCPMIDAEHSFLQIYFMGNFDAELNRRCQIDEQVQRSIILQLQEMLHEHNNLIREFQTAKDIIDRNDNEDYKVIIRADRTPPGEHQRRYNAPVVDEVAAVIVGNTFHERDIVLHKRDERLVRIHDCHPFYDALQYPLILWKGQEGYSFNISLVNPRAGLPQRGKITAMQYYAYFIMVRNGFNTLQRCKDLFHQYAVDMYAKVESERLRFISLNQATLRSADYIHLRDAVTADAAIDPHELGKMVILPSTFINSPRYLAEYTQDAMAFVRVYGRPDLFITFTCNPSWDEIKKELLQNQCPTDRHDIIARVFRQKLMKFLDSITKGCIFGPVVAYVYSIEWQKRGLPHCHILIWLQEKLRPMQIDDIISAEIPNPEEDPVLYDIVVKHMIHGPCGELNTMSPCMKNGKCSKNFPHQLIQETITNESGYPTYKRRSPEDGGFTTTMNIRRHGEVIIDNKWVVPYCPFLTKTFKAHINVECCNSVKAIKYICKYINKGSDQAIFQVQHANRQINPLDEVQMYQAGRYISSNEAIWRLLHFPMHERYPNVVHLNVHLENGQRIYFNEANFQQQLDNPPPTTLTAFFTLCQSDEFARTLLYSEVPQYFTWNVSSRSWKRRKQGVPVLDWPGVKKTNAIGRMYAIHPKQFECFCLRLLLTAVRGPTSFAYIRTVAGEEHPTYRATCEVLGLLQNDDHWLLTMQEAVVSHFPPQLRLLFAIILTSCEVSDPSSIWSKFREPLSEDIVYNHQRQGQEVIDCDHIYDEALKLIDDIIVSISGCHVTDYGLPAIRFVVPDNNDVTSELQYDSLALAAEVEDTLPLLTEDQRSFYDSVLQKIQSNVPAILFLNACGGTGKTFLLNLLLSTVRSHGNIALAIASSGIAATLLKGGRTAHSVLKLPLNLHTQETPVCNISKNSDRAQMLRMCKLLVWDECPMSHKHAFEALDRSLRDLRNNNTVMGGLVVVLAGDFRQTLPVVVRGTPADELNASIKRSVLWHRVTSHTLITNMRVLLHNDNSAANFCEALLQIGNGLLPTDDAGDIKLPPNVCNIVESTDELISSVFPIIRQNYKLMDWLCERAILAPTNDVVNRLNEIIIRLIPGRVKSFKSLDTALNDDNAVNYPTEFLNSLELSGVPSHELRLKIGVPIILMRNLKPPILCNGTRLCVTKLDSKVIAAKVMTGSYKGTEVLIPQIPVIPSDLPFEFKRRQFPVKLAFAMTINKAQGQTLKVAGVHLEKPCFSHGQLYVACSRVSNPKNLHIYAPQNKTCNIVYQNALL